MIRLLFRALWEVGVLPAIYLDLRPTWAEMATHRKQKGKA